MSIRPVFVLLLATTLAAIVVGCGGSDSTTLSPESKAVVTQIENICADTQAKIDSVRGDLPVKDFDPQNPDPADLPAVGNYFAAGHPITEDAIAQARALQVPDEISQEVDTLLTAAGREIDNAKKQAAAAKAADVPGFTATLEEAQVSSDALQAAAKALGVNCPDF